MEVISALASEDIENFDPSDFVKRWSKYSGMTSAEAASESLRNIFGKIVNSRAEDLGRFDGNEPRDGTESDKDGEN